MPGQVSRLDGLPWPRKILIAFRPTLIALVVTVSPLLLTMCGWVLSDVLRCDSVLDRVECPVPGTSDLVTGLLYSVWLLVFSLPIGALACLWYATRAVLLLRKRCKE